MNAFSVTYSKLDQDTGAYILTLSICVDPLKSHVYMGHKKNVQFDGEPLWHSCGATL